MEYTIGEYIRSKGKVYTSSDGYKYFSSKDVGSKSHLGCRLFRNSCKGTAKLDLELNLLYINPFLIILWKITNPDYLYY